MPVPLPQSWREDGCITGDKKGWRRPTKSSSLTPHVRISLQGGLKAPVALFHLLKGGRERLWRAEYKEDRVGMVSGRGNSRSPLPRKGGQESATSSTLQHVGLPVRWTV